MLNFWKPLILIVGLLAPSIATAQALDLSKRPKGPEMILKSYTIEVEQPFESVTHNLASSLGHILELADFGPMVSASYAGFGTPEPLGDYLRDLLPTLNPDLVSDDFPISLNIAVMPSDGTTVMRVMLSVPNTKNASLFGDILPRGGTVLMDDSNVTGCLGQTVLSQSSPVEDAADAYSDALAELGFTLTAPPHVKTSFFVGHGQGCAVFLYIQPDFETPDHSLVVVRFTED